jgi:hypothetical protein
VLVRGEWVESYLVLTSTHLLDLYQEATKAVRSVKLRFGIDVVLDLVGSGTYCRIRIQDRIRPIFLKKSL